jgi:hypothetical protein
MKWKKYIAVLMILTTLAVLTFYSCNKVRNTTKSEAEHKEAEVEMMTDRPATNSGAIEGYISQPGPDMKVTLNDGKNVYTVSVANDGYFIIRNVPKGNYKLKMDAKNGKDTSMDVTIKKGETLNMGTVMMK